MNRKMLKNTTNYEKGLIGEKKAAWLLRIKGYKILQTRYKTPYGEIDIIAKKGKTIALVEVKSRPDIETADQSIHYKQIRRILAAARQWAFKEKRYSNYKLRLDAIIVLPKRFPIHIIDYFLIY